MKGIVETAAKRLELEAVATTNAKLEVWTEMNSATIEDIDKGSYYPSVSGQYARYIITDLNFQEVPGQTVYQYDLTLERVDPSG